MEPQKQARATSDNGAEVRVRIAPSMVTESFFRSMQIELLDRQAWTTRGQLGSAMFEWVEAFYNPTRRHSALGYLSPTDYETANAPAAAAA